MSADPLIELHTFVLKDGVLQGRVFEVVAIRPSTITRVSKRKDGHGSDYLIVETSLDQYAYYLTENFTTFLGRVNAALRV